MTGFPLDPSESSYPSGFYMVSSIYFRGPRIPLSRDINPGILGSFWGNSGAKPNKKTRTVGNPTGRINRKSHCLKHFRWWRPYGYSGTQAWWELLESDKNYTSYFVTMCFAISKSQVVVFEGSSWPIRSWFGTEERWSQKAMTNNFPLTYTFSP